MGLLSARPLNCAHGYLQFWSERTCEVAIPVFRADGSLRALKERKGANTKLPTGRHKWPNHDLFNAHGNGVHDCRAIYGKSSLIGRGVVLRSSHMLRSPAVRQEVLQMEEISAV